MKIAFTAVITLLLGLSVGFFYGFQTGFVGGQAVAYTWGIAFIQKYNALRGGQDVAARDRLGDEYARLMAELCSRLHIYNPFFPVMAKVDQNLLVLAASYEANSQRTEIYPDGKRPTLLPRESSQNRRLEQLIRENRSYYESVLQKEQRLQK